MMVCVMVTLSVPLPANAAFWGVAWTVFKGFVVDVALDVLKTAVVEQIADQDVKALKYRVSELEEQMAVYEREGSYDSKADFETVRETISALNTIVKTLDQRITSLEERMTLVEQELATIKQMVAAYDPESSDALPLQFDINYLYSPDGKRSFLPLPEDGRIYSGYYYKIIFTPKEECFVYIFQQDSSGKIQRLFPMEGFGSITLNNFNPAHADLTYYIPAKHHSFVLDNQVGEEKIYFLASRHRQAALELYQQELLLAEYRKAPSYTAKVEEEILTDIAHAEEKGYVSIEEDRYASPVSWEEEGESFSVVRQRLESCDGCVHVLTFSHQ
jgi:hypothetical protein